MSEYEQQLIGIYTNESDLFKYIYSHYSLSSLFSESFKSSCFKGKEQSFATIKPIKITQMAFKYMAPL